MTRDMDDVDDHVDDHVDDVDVEDSEYHDRCWSGGGDVQSNLNLSDLLSLHQYVYSESDAKGLHSCQLVREGMWAYFLGYASMHA